MSSSCSLLLSLGTLLCIARTGYALKCYSYVCSNQTAQGMNLPNPTCATPQELTCGVVENSGGMVADSCMTQRLKMKSFVGNTAVHVYQEMRNCTLSMMMCAPQMIARLCESANSTGNLVSCQIGCCQGDLCNDDGPVPTHPPQPTFPSGSDLSCYSCDSATPGQPPCSNPAKRTCGLGNNGMKQDSCWTIKSKQGGLEREMRNCSSQFACNKQYKEMICKGMNGTGMVSSCDISCCTGNLCNGDATPTATPSVNVTSGTVETPKVTVSSSAESLSHKLAFFLSMIVIIGKVI